MKQQMAAVYQDFSLRLSQWESKEKRLKEEKELLVVDRDDNKLQLRRTLEILDATADSGTAAQELVKLGEWLVLSIAVSVLLSEVGSIESDGLGFLDTVQHLTIIVRVQDTFLSSHPAWITDW